MDKQAMKSTCISFLIIVLSGCSLVNNNPPSCDSDEVRNIVNEIVAERSNKNKFCINTNKYPEDKLMKNTELYIPSIGSSDCIIDNQNFQRTKEAYETAINIYGTQNNLNERYLIHLKSAVNWILISDMKTTPLSIASKLRVENEWLKYPETKDSTDRGSGYRMCDINAVVKNTSESENFEQVEEIKMILNLYGKNSEGFYSYQLKEFKVITKQN